jgi:hypothetical protein
MAGKKESTCMEGAGNIYVLLSQRRRRSDSKITGRLRTGRSTGILIKYSSRYNAGLQGNGTH